MNETDIMIQQPNLGYHGDKDDPAGDADGGVCAKDNWEAEPLPARPDIGRASESLCQPGTHHVKSENMKSESGNLTRQRKLCEIQI